MLSALADRGQKIAQDEMLAEVRAAPCSLETMARIIVRGTVQMRLSRQGQGDAPEPLRPA